MTFIFFKNKIFQISAGAITMDFDGSIARLLLSQVILFRCYLVLWLRATSFKGLEITQGKSQLYVGNRAAGRQKRKYIYIVVGAIVRKRAAYCWAAKEGAAITTCKRANDVIFVSRQRNRDAATSTSFFSKAEREVFENSKWISTSRVTNCIIITHEHRH